MFKKIATITLAALVLAGVGALYRAEASVDSWSTHAEQLVPFSQSITAGTSAVVFTGSTTVRPNVRAMIITDTVSGVVTFYSDSQAVGSAVIGQFGVIANTPLVISEDQLGQGMKAALGKGLYLTGATGTITVTARIRSDPF